MKASWDIFCSVVDNYGDVGVTWRLARQLVAEHGQVVRLWVDDLAAFVRLCPQATADLACQEQAGVEVRLWPQPWKPVEPAQVVVEAFACELPAQYRRAMAGRARQSLWLNLEYLSAQSWVAGCHGLPSLQANGLRKFFFFPGFQSGTGGLLREHDLLARRDAFQAEEGRRQAFLESLGVRCGKSQQLVSLFSYENAALGDWLDELQVQAQETLLLVPEGRVLPDLQRWAGLADPLLAGQVLGRGALQVQVLPFVAQQDYDLLLWCCDFNLVRGEDSLLRGLWAGRPLLWDIYKQPDGAHLDKLEAFFLLYGESLAPPARQALGECWQRWNQGESMAAGWRGLQAHLPALRRPARLLGAALAAEPDLAAKLVQFCSDWL